MIKRTALIVSVLALSIALSVTIAASTDDLTKPSDLTVHEWGTFTTVADRNGQTAQWLPLSGRSDLPCFVNVADGFRAKSLAVFASPTPNASTAPIAGNPGPELTYAGAKSQLLGSVRMETPVLYFYSPRAQSANVRIAFPRGFVTEWYPQATVYQSLMQPRALQRPTNATITWQNVTILPPGPDATFQQSPAPSHYYAARATDANSVQVNGKNEKFLFYRGVGNFPVPINVTVKNDGKILVKYLAGKPSVILFQNHGGKLGYHVIDTSKNEALLDPPPLTNSFESLRSELEKTLVGQGLYEKEAKAMVETWRDSWFEEGTRVFYIVPQQMVDEILPLTVTPKPVSMARVFVGRVEVITPETIKTVENAILSSDFKTLESYGRLLGPISERILETKQIVDVRNAALTRYINAPGTCGR